MYFSFPEAYAIPISGQHSPHEADWAGVGRGPPRREGPEGLQVQARGTERDRAGDLMIWRQFELNLDVNKSLQVVFSRNVIMAPGMILLPLAMSKLERRPWFARATYLHAPFQASVALFRQINLDLIILNKWRLRSGTFLVFSCDCLELSLCMHAPVY